MTDGHSAAFLDKIPEHYDRDLGPTVFIDYADDLAHRVAAHGPKRVLETAAGTGIVTRRLRDLLPTGTHLTATDLNAPMLDVARRKLRPGEQLELQPADAAALPFPDEAFDAVVCQFGLMFFPDKDKSYREAYRVLEPGGRYLFSVWDAHRHNRFAKLVHEFIGGLFPADPPRFYEVPFSYHRIDPIKEAVTAAGFTDFRATVLHIDKAVPDMASLARGLIYGNPVVEEIRLRGGNPAHVFEGLAGALRREFGDPGHIPLQVIFFEATRP